MGIPRWAKAMLSVRRQTEKWIKSSIDLNHKTPWSGGHDEGTFMSSWFGFFQLTGDETIGNFLRWMCDGFCDWSERNLYHGYYPKGEVHHQPETFLIFLTRMLHLDPNHDRTVAAMTDMAHHIGNWVKGVPKWYDWREHRFKSYYLGTREVGKHPQDYEVPDHLRLAQISLVTYLVTGEQPYLDLVLDYSNRWLTLILEKEDAVPSTLLRADADYPTELVEKARRPMPEAVELHVAAGSLDMFMDIHQVTGEKRYLEPVRKMLPTLLPSIADPYSEVPGAILSRYRQISGDLSFDGAAMELVSSMPDRDEFASLLLMQDSMPLPHPMGIGRRRDDLRWGYKLADGSLAEEHGASPASLLLAYHITDEEHYATSALNKVARRLALARASLRDGRHHGCAGGTVGALASGHGRAFGTGHITSVFHPLSFGGLRFCNGERAVVRYFAGDGSFGLPEGIAALVSERQGGRCKLKLCNSTDSPVAIDVSHEPEFIELRPMGRTTDGKTTRVILQTGQCETISL